MRQLIVKQLDYDLTPVAGLALVGHYLGALRPVLARLDAALPVKSGVANSDIVRSYVGLLVQGKSDFDAIENLRGDAFYKQALGIALLPVLVAGREPELVRLPTGLEVEPRIIWQGVHRDLMKSARVQAVMSFLADVVATEV